MKCIWKGLVLTAGVLAIADAAAVGAFFNMAAGRRSIFFRKKSAAENQKKLGHKRHKSRKQIRKVQEELKKKQVQAERDEGIRWIDGMNCEKVEIKSRDGLRLAGYYLEAEGPKRIVALFHGWRGSWRHDFGACLQWLYEEGTSLLLVEQRAQGESDGRYMGFGILERQDCYAWLDWLGRRNPKRLPVYLYGVSMGAATVLMAAGEDLPEDVKGVIADCGFTSPYEMVYRFGRNNFRLPEHPLMDQLDWLFQRRAGYGLKEYSAPEAMKQCRAPVLFIHGKADTFVPYEMTVRNYEACRGWKKLLLVEGADHCMSFLKDREAYKKAVLELFWEGGTRKKGIAAS